MLSCPSDIILMEPKGLAAYFQNMGALCGLVESIIYSEASGAMFAAMTPEAFVTALNRPLDPCVLRELRLIQSLIQQKIRSSVPSFLDSVCKGVVLGCIGTPFPDSSDHTFPSDIKDPRERCYPYNDTSNSRQLYEIAVLGCCNNIILHVPMGFVSSYSDDSSCPDRLSSPLLPRGSLVDIVLKNGCSARSLINTDHIKLVVPCSNTWEASLMGLLSLVHNHLSTARKAHPAFHTGIYSTSPFTSPKNQCSHHNDETFTRIALADVLESPEAMSQEHTSYMEQAAFRSIDEDIVCNSSSQDGLCNPNADHYIDSLKPVSAPSPIEYEPLSPPSEQLFPNYLFPNGSKTYTDLFGRLSASASGEIPCYTDTCAVGMPSSNFYTPLSQPSGVPIAMHKSLSDMPLSFMGAPHIILPNAITNAHVNNRLLNNTMQCFNGLIYKYNPMLVLPLSTRFRGRIEFIQDGYGCIVCPPFNKQSQGSQSIPTFMNPEFVMGTEQAGCASMRKVFQSLVSIPQDVHSMMSYSPPNISLLSSFNIADGLSLCCFFAAPWAQTSSNTLDCSLMRGDIVEFNLVHGYGYVDEYAIYGSANQPFYPLVSNAALEALTKQGGRLPKGKGEKQRTEKKKGDDSQMKHSLSAPTVSMNSPMKFNRADLTDYYFLHQSASNTAEYITLLADKITVVKNTRVTKSQWHSLLVDGHIYQGIVYTFNEAENYGFIKSYGNRMQAGTLSQGIEVYFRPSPSSTWKPERGCFVSFKAKWVDSKAQAREVKPIYSRTSSFFFGQCLGVFPPFAIIRAIAYIEQKLSTEKHIFSGRTVDFLQCRNLLATGIDPEPYIYDGQDTSSSYGGTDPYWASDIYFVRTKTLAQALKISLSVGSYVGFNIDPDISTHLRAVNLSVIDPSIFTDILSYIQKHSSNAVIPSLQHSPLTQHSIEKLPWSLNFRIPTRAEPTPLRAFTFHLELGSLQAVFQEGTLQDTGFLHTYQIRLSSKYDTQLLSIPMNSVLRPLEVAVPSSQYVFVCPEIDSTNVLPSQLHELGYSNTLLPDTPSPTPTVSLALLVNSSTTCYAMQVSYITDEYVILNGLTIKYDACTAAEYVEPNLFYVGVPRSTYPLGCMFFGMTVYLTVLSTKPEQLANGLVLGKLFANRDYILVVFILSSVDVEITTPAQTQS